MFILIFHKVIFVLPTPRRDTQWGWKNANGWDKNTYNFVRHTHTPKKCMQNWAISVIQLYPMRTSNHNPHFLLQIHTYKVPNLVIWGPAIQKVCRDVTKQDTKCGNPCISYNVSISKEFCTFKCWPFTIWGFGVSLTVFWI